ncbi:hypothetical protein B8V81_3938 [Paenibacillus pasadenensis]|uniref:Uncharacterized protein n=1 Tax=Paenibacillus pasadenensis TaxID=217090 RepID=A0A2N5N583_9BACL|nr:hypothetical protein B8V81_3938 [Paenibacillus pasadenensis]
MIDYLTQMRRRLVPEADQAAGRPQSLLERDLHARFYVGSPKNENAFTKLLP